MSSLIVRVCAIEKIEKHPNADLLEIVHVKGWQCIVRKGQLANATKCVFFPPDTILPTKVTDKLGATSYLCELPKNSLTGARPDARRIRVSKLRGVPSFGLIAPVDDPSWEIDKDVAEYYGAEKWEQPVHCHDTDAVKTDPVFHKYTDIENFKNFPDVIVQGEDVVFCEKVHGMNTKVAYIRRSDDDGNQTFQFVAGSHRVQRKEFDANGNPSPFWYFGLTDNVKNLLKYVSGDDKNVIVFGELVGCGVQDMEYGYGPGQRAVLAFDISVNGNYLDFDEKMELFSKFSVPTVPLLYRGPFSLNILEYYTNGPTTLCSKEKAGNFSGREGVVITPVKERMDPRVGGRVILKSVSFDYLNRKNGTEYH